VVGVTFLNMASEQRTPMETGPVKYAWIAFAVVAYPAMAGGLFFLVSNTVFWARAASTEGVIVGFEAMEDDSTTHRQVTVMSVDRARANVVSFRDEDGEDHIFVTEWGSAAAVYDQGETVTVLYRPEDPSQAKIRGFISLYLGPLLLILLGAAFWVSSVLARYMVG
jgi:hypothetical protein